MTHTLEDLKSGKLNGSRTLKLACGLTEFPQEIIALADTLEVLDLSDNQLDQLPASVARLKKLRVIFFARNHFTKFPAVLANCPVLSMIGFKSNSIHSVPENAFPESLRWLILTDNTIEKLPKSIGDCRWLRKCALAGNQISVLPVEMANCQDLELLRISANTLETIPKWLFELPRLSWIGFGGNPATPQISSTNTMAAFDWGDFAVQELIGEGASGLISRAHWNSKKVDIAIKVFKGALTSDGLPEDEMAMAIAAGTHDNLIPILGKIKGHPESKSGLIMELIASTYQSLGNPPSLETCTRDVFDPQRVFTQQQLLKIAKSIASVCVQLHERGINHGDLYAHNIVVNKTAECLLGDFGAASFYDVDSVLAPVIERVEVRALGCLIEDILRLVPEEIVTNKRLNTWQELIANCSIPEVSARPSFSEILGVLERF